ncbi:calcyclin-binding protein-like [Trichoplusia ni]|uniref:Calcyclin-binding protein n=1 Tax=Trichoplusia ni TaxID=7111 RepID=A0A7E5VBK1_TRINI|nr:calcyclin-binding protein-like [Trichoplusia ni]XP_026746507.1 calcyclin-binding protein-like [Trichoplusia ni]
MSEARMKELRSDVDELNELLKLAKRKRAQDLISLEVRKLETELIKIKETIAKNAQAESTPAPSTAPAQSKRYQIKLNGYGWDQSDKFIKIFVTLKDVQSLPKDQVFCKLTEKSMELHVKDLDNKDYLLVINKLLDSINVEESYWKQKTDMVVIFLAKSHPNVKWSHMTELEKKTEDQRNNKMKPPTPDMDKSDPQESIMSLMKNMYETGDDDMKRMISKAWYEGQHKKKDTLDL